MTYPKEVEETIGIPIEVEPLDHTKLDDLGVNTCSHNLFLSSREAPSVDESEPRPLPNFLSLERLGHANMRLIQSLAFKELVRYLPKRKFDQHFCDACKIGKQAHTSHKAKNIVSTTRYLELLHMDLFGPSAVRSYGGNRYTLVIVDDYSRYSWTRFIKDKTEAFDQFEIFSKEIQNQLGCTIVLIRTDHGREFDNEVQFGELCTANGHFVVNFVIQSKRFSLTLDEFGQILKIPFKGQASHTDMWSLDHLSIGVSSKGRYKTTPTSSNVIKSFIQVPRQGQPTHTKNKKTIFVGRHKDHAFACLCHMLYCIETSTPYNLAFFILKRTVKTQNKRKELLPYGMLLTILFKHVVSISPELASGNYLSHDRAMHLLTPHYEQKTRSNQGKKRPRESNASSSSATQNHPFSSIPLDFIVDEIDDETFHSNSSPS
nr:retrovirus-related Pol polyprotein from transposon TNT 1-94 [Tanacetum cinerariifolium]